MEATGKVDAIATKRIGYRDVQGQTKPIAEQSSQVTRAVTTDTSLTQQLQGQPSRNTQVEAKSTTSVSAPAQKAIGVRTAQESRTIEAMLAEITKEVEEETEALRQWSTNGKGCAISTTAGDNNGSCDMIEPSFAGVGKRWRKKKRWKLN